MIRESEDLDRQLQPEPKTQRVGSDSQEEPSRGRKRDADPPTAEKAEDEKESDAKTIAKNKPTNQA